MKNIVNQNEEEVMKNQKIKNAMLVCISNCLKKLNTEKIEIRKNETIEGIEYLKENYKNFFIENSGKNVEQENINKLNQVVGKVNLFNN